MEELTQYTYVLLTWSQPLFRNWTISLNEKSPFLLFCKRENMCVCVSFFNFFLLKTFDVFYSIFYIFSTWNSFGGHNDKLKMGESRLSLPEGEILRLERNVYLEWHILHIIYLTHAHYPHAYYLCMISAVDVAKKNHK